MSDMIFTQSLDLKDFYIPDDWKKARQTMLKLKIEKPRGIVETSIPISPEVTSCSHEAEIFSIETRNLIVKNIMKCLARKKHKFDAIAVSGYSMSLIAPIIADKLQKNLVLVRKDSERRVSGYTVEGEHNQRCILIDDLISSGETFDRVLTSLEKINCTLVGYVLYNSMRNSTRRDVPCFGSFNINLESDIKNRNFKIDPP